MIKRFISGGVLLCFSLGVAYTQQAWIPMHELDMMVLPPTDPYLDYDNGADNVYNVIPEEYRGFVLEVSELYNVPWTVIHTVASHESGYTAWATGPKNSNGTFDVGIMQLNSKYLDEFVDKFWHGDEPFSPYNGFHSIEVGTKYLATLYEATGNWEDAVTAYNIGIGSLYRGEKQEAGERYMAGIMKYYLDVRRNKG